MTQPIVQTLLPHRNPELLHGFPAARPLLGRSAAVSEVSSWLDEAPALVTLLGPPGIGKTSLATWVAMRWGQPAWFCDLTTCRDAQDLRHGLLAAFGEPAGEAHHLERALVEHAPSLVVLDNFEQLVNEADKLAGWRAVVPPTRWLVTSRERLAVDGERVVELGPLGLPDAETPTEASLAFKLFVARARDAGGRGLDQTEAIGAIVAALDGVPLAIELAAARTRLLAPEVLADRIEGGLLSMSKRGPVRHRTLADAIAWSWALLTAAEQLTLAGCAVFTGSFSPDMVERVLTDEPDVIDHLASLRDKSLVHAIGDRRLGLYASIRAYARAQWECLSPGWRQGVVTRHAKLFAEMAESYNRHRLIMSRAWPVAFPGDFRRDVGNLQQALSVAEDGDRVELASALIVLGGIDVEDALALPDGSPPMQRAVVQMARHRLLVARGELEEAHALLLRLMEDETAPLEARGLAGIVAGARRRIEGHSLLARAHHQRAAEWLDAELHPALYGVNVACLGRLGCDFDDAEAAEGFNEAAVRHQERLGEWWLAALALANLAQRAQERGDFERAESLLERAVARFREADETTYESVYAAICGGLYLEQGRFEIARKWFSMAPVPDDQVSIGVPRLLRHGGHAVLEALEGHADAALEQLERARRATAHAGCDLVRSLEALYGAAVDLALGRMSASDREAWRRRLVAEEGVLGRLRRTNLDVRFAFRMVGLALAGTGPHLRVEPQARWFELDGERVDLSRRGAPRRILLALVEAQQAGGGALDGVTLVGRGWPGERILVDAAATRVRVAIATLRKLGLREAIVTRDDGYVMDPGLTLEVVRPR